MILPAYSVFPGQVFFRPGSLGDFNAFIRNYGQKGLVLHGSAFNSSPQYNSFVSLPGVDLLLRRGGEPQIQELSALLIKTRREKYKWIAGAGGGSILDLAKACAGLFFCEKDPSCYQKGEKPELPGIPFFAVPSTAGTGSEATPNAVLTNSITGEKLSIRSEHMTAQAVFLDPELLLSASRAVIAGSGMDALTQAIESYFSRNSSLFTDWLAEKAFVLTAQSLEKVFSVCGKNQIINEHSSLMAGSFMAGMSLAQARLGLVHGLAHPLGSLYHIPHGELCAFLLPYILKINREQVKIKYDKLSSLVNCDLQSWVSELNQKLQIKNPFQGKKLLSGDFIINQTLISGSTAANPVKADRQMINNLLSEFFL